MQQRVLLGAGVAVVAVAAFFAFRSATHHVTTQVVDKNIDRIVATLPPGYAVTHGATETNPLTGTLTLHDFKLAYDGQTVWSADTVTVSGADEHALHDVFDPGAYPNGHPAWTTRRLLIADATASGVVIPAQKGDAPNATIKSITLHQLSGRPFMLPPTRDHLNEPAFRADAALAFAFQSLDQHDLAIAAAPPKINKVTLATVSLREYDGGKIGSAAAHDLAVEASGGTAGQTITHATLDSIEIRNFDASAALDKQRQTSTADKSAFSGMSYESFDVAGLKVDVSPGPRISMRDLEGKFPAADGTGIRTGEGSMTGLTLALKDTVIPPTASAVIAAFGMDSLTIDVTGKAHTNEAAQHTDFAEDIVLHSLGTLHLAADIAGYDTAAAKTDPKAALMATTLNNATIAWTDAGLVDRSLNAAAAQMHTTPSVIRAQLAMPLVTLGLMIPDQPDATDQVTAFLNHPGTLTVTLTPPQKVTFADIAAAPTEGKAHLLGVHIQAK